MEANGKVRLFRANNAWNAIDQNGNAINISTSTTCGLQEVINAGFGNGYPTEIVSSRGVPIICQSPVSVPPGFNSSLTVGVGVAVAFVNLGATPCVTFDSLENCLIDWGGQIVQQAGDTAPAVLIKPRNGAPITGNITVAASIIHMDTVAPADGGGGVLIDLAQGGFNGNKFRLMDSNGGQYSLAVTDPGSANIAFLDNQINYGYLHRFSQYGIRVGSSGANKANIKRNKWYCGRLSGNGTSSVAFSTWAGGDDIYGFAATNEEGPLNVGMQFLSMGNKVFGCHIDGAVTPISGGAGNSFY